MRETSFIQQNEKKWQAFEQILDGQLNDPDKLNDLFIQVTDDLSYARTFYPNRSVRVYLNGLAQKVFFNIYKTKKSRWQRFTLFWVDELPRLLFESRWELLLAFLVFSLAIGIGMLSSAADPDFLQVILGEEYVEMTKENIKSGDPMAVYKQHGAFNMFLGITLNNIFVAFLTFVMGVFVAIGTIGSLLYNGIMLGAFQYFFIEKGLFWESFLAVWLHGAFEISSIVIAGGAGITMGRGLAFPGTLTRARSFQLAARRGMSIMIGVIPLFVFAGFTESFLTRHTEAPDWLRGGFIFLCFAIVLFYFVLYPFMRAKKGFVTKDEGHLIPDVNRQIDFTAIKTTGDLFTDTFIFFRKNLKTNLLAALAGAVFFCLGAFSLASVGPAELFSSDQGWLSVMELVPSFFRNEGNPWVFLFITLATAFVVFVVQDKIDAWWRRANGEEKEAIRREKLKAGAVSYLKILGVVAVFNLIFLIGHWLLLGIVLLLMPFLFLWTQVMATERRGFFTGLVRATELGGGFYGQMLGLSGILIVVGLLFSMILGSGLLSYLFDVVSMNFYLSAAAQETLSTILLVFIVVFVLLAIFGLWVTGFGMLYFSCLEVHEAKFLKKRLELIGQRHRIRGLEREA